MECRRCKQEKSEDEFNWKIKAEGKRQTVCRECSRAVQKQHREQHSEQYAENRRKRYQENIEKIRVGRREEYARNREKFLEYNRKWREQNPEAYKQSRQNSYEKYRNERLEANDEYRKQNRAELNKKAREKYSEKMLSDKEWREKERLRSLERNRREKERMLDAYGRKCACCGETEILFLTLDHIDGGGNEERRKFGIQGGHAFYLFLRKNGYPPGYQVLCFNCNAGKHLNNGVCPHKHH